MSHIVQNPHFLKKFQTPPPQDGPVEIVAIIDRSSSMDSLRDEAIAGFNKFINEQQAAPGEANFTLILFSDKSEQPLTSVPLQEVANLSRETYICSGMTALNDAIGDALATLFERNPKRAIVTILTDGEENSSKRYNSARIKEMIERAQTRGWQIVYLGANQDAFKVADKYGLLRSSTANFKPTSQGVHDAYTMASATTLNYRGGDTSQTLSLGKDH